MTFFDHATIIPIETNARNTQMGIIRTKIMIAKLHMVLYILKYLLFHCVSPVHLTRFTIVQIWLNIKLPIAYIVCVFYNS